MGQRYRTAVKAVTRWLVHRLEAKGFARRIPNPADGRSFLIETVADRLSGLGELFTDSTRSLTQLCSPYDDELRKIIEFMTESA